MNAKMNVYDPKFLEGPMLPVSNSIISFEPKNGDNIHTLKNISSPFGLPPLGETSLVHSNGKFFLMGGRTSDGFLSDKVFVSEDLNNWSEGKSLLKARARHATAVTPSGLVLIIGGMILSDEDGCLELSWDIDAYNPVTDKWDRLSKIPKRVEKHVAEIVNNKLYIIAGDSGTLIEPERPVFPAECRGDNQILNLETMEWTIGSPKPTHETGVTSAVLDDEIYVVSSDNPLGRIDDIVEVYNTKSDTWRKIPNMPTARTNVPCGFIDGKLYCVNGLGKGLIPLSIIEIYDPKSNTWTTDSKSLLPSSHSAGYTAVDGCLHIVGGCI